MTQHPDIGIIVVIYKSLELVVDYVTHQLSKVTTPHITVVVDVGSPVEHATHIADTLSATLVDGTSESWNSVPNTDLYVLHTPENLGYARGNNLGARFLLQLFPTIHKLLVSNDDIAFVDDNVVETLAKTLDEHPNVGCVGPKVIDLQDNLCEPLYNKPNPWYFVKRNIGEPIFGAKRFYEKHHGEYKEGEAWVVRGCFHMLRTEAFLNIGMFDPRTFLYWEEQILSYKLNEIGFKTYYNPNATVRHFVGNTTSKNAPNLLLLNCELHGQRLYFNHIAPASAMARLCLNLSAWIRLALVKLAVLKRKLKH